MYISPVSIVLYCIYQSKKCCSVDLCWFVITSGTCKTGQQPKGITDVQLRGASGGTEVTATDHRGSSQIIEDQKSNISHTGNKD